MSLVYTRRGDDGKSERYRVFRWTQETVSNLPDDTRRAFKEACSPLNVSKNSQQAHPMVVAISAAREKIGTFMEHSTAFMNRKCSVLGYVPAMRPPLGHAEPEDCAIVIADSLKAQYR